MKTRLFFIGMLVLLGACQPAVRFTSVHKFGYEAKDTVDVGSHKASPKEPKIGKIESENISSIRKKVIKEAFNWIGTGYCYGGTSKNCVDCSGFTQIVYAQNGFILPRTAKEQFDFSKKIKAEEALPGDLVFFQNGHKINHVGIYVGNDEFVHSSTSAGVVKQSIKDAYFRNRFVGFGRVINY